MCCMQSDRPDDCLEQIKIFLKHGQSVNATGAAGHSILHRENSIDVVKFLIEETEIDAELKLTGNLTGEIGNHGDTALDVAQRMNFNEIVSILEKVI